MILLRATWPRTLIVGAVASSLLLAPTVATSATNSLSTAGSSTSAAKLAATKSDQGLVNEQLVVASLDPSGLPEQSELINRIVATGFEQQTIPVETSTNRLQFLDQPGAPEIDGLNVLYPVGGKPQTTATSIADFEKPLPIALHAEYATPNGGQRGVNPADIPGKSGDLAVTYTVTNTTVKRQEVTYQNAAGVSESEELPVFAPFVGVLQATLPPAVKISDPGDAVLGTSTTGETTLTWNLVLYPPIGSYEQRLNFQVTSSELSIPGVTMEVMPITNGQSPATAFTSKLLGDSVKGNQGLVSGLEKINSGILELGDGASKLANGGAELSAGLGKTQTGASGLTTGLNELTSGLNQLTSGLEQLSGPEGLPAAAGSSEQLAAAVQQLAVKIGGPWNKPLPDPLPEPLPKNVTLYQMLEVLQRGSRGVAKLSAEVALAVTQAAVELDGISEDATKAKDDADAAVAKLDPLLDDLCDPPLAITQEQCDDLAEGSESAAAASTNAASAASRAEVQDGKLVVAGGKAAIVAAATELTHQIMPILLRQVTALSLTLDGRDSGTAGVYQGLLALSGALLRSATAAGKLADGAGGAATGSGELATGTNQLDQALLALLDGSTALTGGASALADGSSKLSTEGTERMTSEIIAASTKPGLADAYLSAASKRATESAPYPAPAGGVSHIAYVYSMASVTNTQSSPAVALAIIGLLVVGGGILTYRRIRTAPTN